jgi:putative SOS response-associated peptidase YedK
MGRFTFNTRSDGILKTGLWKTSFEERRCIVPADSFFEWKRLHKKNNPKYEITIPGRTLCIDGHLENVEEQGGRLCSYCLRHHEQA